MVSCFSSPNPLFAEGEAAYGSPPQRQGDGRGGVTPPYRGNNEGYGSWMRYFLSYHDDKDGYGYAGLKVLQALERLTPGEWRGVDVLQYEQRSPRVRWSLSGQWEVVALCVPEWWPLVGARRLVGYTMFESTRMPAQRVALINRCAEVCLVPCAWCAVTFQAQGVRVPLRVVRWGIDPQDYYFLDRSDHDGPYTFLWSGTPDMR